MQKKYILLSLIPIQLCLSVCFAQDSASTDLISLLKGTTPYNAKQKHGFPDFTYQSPTDLNLTDLRLIHHLDSIAGKGGQIEKAIRLMQWLHDEVPHEDVKPLAILNAKTL